MMLGLMGLVRTDTPYHQSEPLRLSVGAPTAAPTQFSVVELPIDLHATFDNPFDPDDIRVDAEITDPKGGVTRIPGFFGASAERKLLNGVETLSVGKTGWAVRFCPKVAGEYRVSLTAKDRSGTQSVPAKVVQVTPASGEGFIQLSPQNKRFFAFESGKAFWPIGANTAWAGPRGTFDYDDWLPEYAKSGCNYGRLWLSPQWVTFALERPGKSIDGHGMGQFDLGNAWRLDYVLQKAQAQGMSLMITLDSYNALRDKDSYPSWEQTPHNSDNGGPLRVWSAFWQNDAMDKFYRDRLRYLVARYSAYRSVFAWEFWNEVDLVRDYRLDQVGPWHRKMGQYLRSIDPYHHLVSTSMSDPMGSRELQLLPELDFVQTHLYSDLVTENIINQQQRKAQWGKAHYIGESGADAAGPRTVEDPTGIQVHDPIWAAISNASSGSSMPWWWDSLIHPKMLYPLFGVASKFVSGVDWPSENFQQVDPEVRFADPAIKPVPSDLIFDSGLVGWAAGPEYQPRTITIVDGRVMGDRTLAGIMHGKTNHPDLYNPVTFEVRFSKPTRLEVEVGDVSGWGGAGLRISLDGDRRLSRDFTDTNTDGKHEVLQKYAGSYGIDIPAGRHSIKVENTGADWFMCSYRFKNVVLAGRPNVSVWASLGNNTVLVWARAQGRSWKNLVVRKQTPPPVPATVLGLDGLASGDWHAEIWNTWTGEIIAQRQCLVRNDGHARIDLPGFEKDIAIKLTRLP